MAKTNSKYSFCDFCHKGYPGNELEKVVIVCKKCKNCFPTLLGGNDEALKSAVKPTAVVKPKRTSAVPTAPIPPQFREAFSEPQELKPHMPLPVQSLEPKTENHNSNEGTDTPTV